MSGRSSKRKRQVSRVKYDHFPNFSKEWYSSFSPLEKMYFHTTFDLLPVSLFALLLLIIFKHPRVHYISYVSSILFYLAFLLYRAQIKQMRDDFFKVIENNEPLHLETVGRAAFFAGIIITTFNVVVLIDYDLIGQSTSYSLGGALALGFAKIGWGLVLQFRNSFREWQEKRKKAN
jgi:hypothetical protein